MFERNADKCKLTVKRRSSLTIAEKCSTPNKLCCESKAKRHLTPDIQTDKSKPEVILSLHASCRDHKINILCLSRSIFLTCFCVWARLGLHIMREGKSWFVSKHHVAWATIEHRRAELCIYFNKTAKITSLGLHISRWFELRSLHVSCSGNENTSSLRYGHGGFFFIYEKHFCLKLLDFDYIETSATTLKNPL